jgi:hypothetical protein
MKNHPTQDQWMDYLYGEMQTAERKSVEAHVTSCAPCRAQQAEFTGTMESLDTWRVTVPQKHSLSSGASRFQPVVKWAAAAALLATTAFATGRFSKPEVDVNALQARISAQVQSEIRTPLEQRIQEEIEAAAEQAVLNARARLETEVAARIQEISMRAQSETMLAAREQMDQLAAQLATLRDEDRKRLNQAMKTFETQWLAEYRKMREDLERVALFSDESFRKAQRQLGQLASYNQPAESAIDGTDSEN